MILRSLASAALAGALAVWLAPRLGELPAAPASEEEVRLPARVLQTASVGYEAALSDWYWLQAIQYFGTSSHASEYYRQLPGYLEAATDLDPDFGSAYILGGNCIPQEDLEKKWHNTGAAIKLLQKGVSSASTIWQIPYLLAYNLYIYRGDYLLAARYMQVAATRPGAPHYLSSFVATLVAQGHGDLQTAIDFTTVALQNAPEHWTRDDLIERLKGLRLQQALDQLNAAVKGRLATGHAVTRIDDLVGAGGVSQLPADPYGGVFRIEGDHVVSSNEDKLPRIFVHPGESGPTLPYVD